MPNVMPKLSDASSKPSGEPGWKWRRMLMFPVVGVSIWRLIALESAADTQVNQLLATGWLWLLFGYFCVFTGFATAQDVVAIFTTRSGLPYAPPPAGSVRTVAGRTAVPPPEKTEQE